MRCWFSENPPLVVRVENDDTLDDKKYFDGDILAQKIQPTLETFYACGED